MPKEGFVKLWRKIQDSEVWQEKKRFTRREAWIDILMEVRFEHDPKKFTIGDKEYICHRGEIFYSLETWANRWHCDKSRARRILKYLADKKMIETESDTVTTRVFVVSYAKYQDRQSESETVFDTPLEKNERFSTHFSTHLEDTSIPIPEGDTGFDKNKSETENERFSTPTKEEKEEKESKIQNTPPLPPRNNLDSKSKIQDNEIYSEKFAEAFINLQKLKFKNKSFNQEEQKKYVMELLDAGYTQKQLTLVGRFLKFHGDDNFRWRDQVQSLSKLLKKPIPRRKPREKKEEYDERKENYIYAGYKNWCNVFIDLANEFFSGPPIQEEVPRATRRRAVTVESDDQDAVDSVNRFMQQGQSNLQNQQ